MVVCFIYFPRNNNLNARASTKDRIESAHLEHEITRASYKSMQCEQ